MNRRLQALTCLEPHSGMMKTSATFQEPMVRLAVWNGDMPSLIVEEGGVVVALEFVDMESLLRFQSRLSSLRPDE